jgi:hypothetical protein
MTLKNATEQLHRKMGIYLMVNIPRSNEILGWEGIGNCQLFISRMLVCGAGDLGRISEVFLRGGLRSLPFRRWLFLK